MIYSAHGVAPEVRQASKLRELRVIDATCPLVTKVHVEAVKFAREGYSLILIGHRDHDEVIGTLGEAPLVTQVVDSPEDVDGLHVPDPERVAYLTQTTLSLDETTHVIEALRQRFPNIQGPHAQDICYATENRQTAVKEVAAECDLLLVVGSDNSSNSNRLVEVARNLGLTRTSSRTIRSIRPEWLQGVKTVGLTAGASAPEILVQEAVTFLEEQGFTDMREVEVMPENVRFGLPPGDRGGDWRGAGSGVGVKEEMAEQYLRIRPKCVSAKSTTSRAASRRRWTPRASTCSRCRTGKTATGAANWAPTRRWSPTTSCCIGCWARKMPMRTQKCANEI